MKKNVLMKLGIYLGCSILVAVGDALYRHFGKGLTITDAFWQVMLAYGTLFVLIGIAFVVIMFIYFVSIMITRKKDKLSEGNSNKKI